MGAMLVRGRSLVGLAGRELRADAAALESIMIRYGLDMRAESAAAASRAAAVAAAHRFDMYVMRQSRLACLNHRVVTVGLLRLHQLHSSVAPEHADGL